MTASKCRVAGMVASWEGAAEYWRELSVISRWAGGAAGTLQSVNCVGGCLVCRPVADSYASCSVLPRGCFRWFCSFLSLLCLPGCVSSCVGVRVYVFARSSVLCVTRCPRAPLLFCAPVLLPSWGASTCGRDVPSLVFWNRAPHDFPHYRSGGGSASCLGGAKEGSSVAPRTEVSHRSEKTSQLWPLCPCVSTGGRKTS